MSIRTTRKIVEFTNPFSMKGVGRVLPAGNYEIVTDEELIEGLSFPVYRRVATMMLAYSKSSGVPSTDVDHRPARSRGGNGTRQTDRQSYRSIGKATMMRFTRPS